MNNTEFKKILQMCTNKIGFKYYKKNYYYQGETLIIVINTQKSNYDDSYYINYGFWIKSIHENLENPKINECDIVGRFLDYSNGMKKFDFQLNTFNDEKLIECLDYNMSSIVVPVINGGIQKYFELFPNAILTAKLKLKDYLNSME